MPLQNIIKKNVTYASLDTSIREVARIMAEDDVGAVVVVNEGVPQGIVTDRDIVLRCTARDVDPYTAVEKIMSHAVETVTLKEGIFDLVQKMKKAAVRRVVVVDESGNAVGLLSFDDVFDLLTHELNDLRQTVAPKKAKIAA